jgi:hypothetical protein
MAAQPRPVTVPLAPPAHAVRRQAGLGIPSVRDVAEATAGGLAGAILAATFITVMPSPATKWIGALLGLGTGVILATSSPIGTLPQEMGVGALALSGGWMWFDLLGAVKTTPGQAGAVWLRNPGATASRP